MASMTRVRAAAGGLATPSMATYYAQRATAGLIISEGAQPSLIGQSNPGTPGLHTDEQVSAWRPVTAAVHASGGRGFAQIMHGGRGSPPHTPGAQPARPPAVPPPPGGRAAGGARGRPARRRRVPAARAQARADTPRPGPLRGARARRVVRPSRPPCRRGRLRRRGVARRERLLDLPVPLIERQP